MVEYYGQIEACAGLRLRIRPERERFRRRARGKREYSTQADQESQGGFKSHTRELMQRRCGAVQHQAAVPIAQSCIMWWWWLVVAEYACRSALSSAVLSWVVNGKDDTTRHDTSHGGMEKVCTPHAHTTVLPTPSVPRIRFSRVDATSVLVWLCVVYTVLYSSAWQCGHCPWILSSLISTMRA